MKIKDKILSETSEETKQKIRDNANKLVMKQETLEEVAENSFLANKLENSNAVEKAHYIAGFRESAKWQKERSYSEEEMRECYEFAIENVQLGRNGYEWVTFDEWFEQFKKK